MNAKTNDMKKVLIALDYHPIAQKVAEAGFSLAKTMDAEIILLHVIPDATYYTELEYFRIEGFMGFSDAETSHLFDKGLKKAMKGFLDKFKHKLGDETIKTLVKEGDYADSILKTATDLQVDIIVMGSHSRKWLELIVLGSVTEKVLGNTTIPLFIIPTKKHN